VVQRIELKESLEIALPDGSTAMLRPGPYGKGVSVAVRPAAAAGRTARGRAPGEGGQRGRPPRPSTLELRAMLQADAAAGHLKSSSEYIDWLVKQEPKAKRPTLQQTVYRELRAVGGGRGRGRRGKGDGMRGRKPNAATVQLRERLQKDKEAGNLRDAAHYVKWLVEKASIGIKQARPIVYRELRSA
jgi:hypothetical protein